MASFLPTASASTAAAPGCAAAAAAARRGGRCAAVGASAAPGRARTHYEVLGVCAGASRGEIKAAYRRLAREVHPDAGGCGGGGEGFIRLHAAYATLADPDERARYDRATMVPAAGVRREPSAFRPRRWETDQCW